MGATSEISEFCSQIRYESLPPEVIDKVRYLALDFIGVAARGSRSEAAVTMRQLVTDLGVESQGGVVIGTGMRAPHHYAALANGTAGHTLELDDLHNESSAHIGVAVFPAALAAAELSGASEPRFIEGVVAGYEVTARLGKALHPASHYARGFHPTATCGTLGAAMTAARILGLTPLEMARALGIAGSQAAGLMEFLAEGAWTKAMHPGWAAHSGLIAARLARRGFRGPSTVVEGRLGFLHAYSDGADTGQFLAGLGESYEITRTSVKPHACCRYEQGPIDGILKIMAENRLKADDVERVTLGILKAGWAIVCEPREKKLNPTNVMEAQLNMPFGAALALLFGRVSLDQYTADNLRSPRIKELMNRVVCVEDPTLERCYPKQWPASVEILTRGGQTFRAGISSPRGDWENPLTWEEIEAKFDELAAPVFSEDRRKLVKARIRKLGTDDSITSLAEPLTLRLEATKASGGVSKRA